MVGVTNSMVGYYLITEGHSIQLRSGGTVPQQVQGSVLIITIILILIFSEFLIKLQSNLSLKFL